jgi:hypothetical protein
MSGILMMSVGNSYGALPVNTVAPVVSGTATVGQTLSTTSGTWIGAPTPTFTYQWQRNGSNIGSATSTTYTVQFVDVGTTIRCVVTATNTLGVVSANSNSTGTVSPPAIGSSAGGGFYAGQISTTANGVATHYLIVGPLSSAQNASKQWKTSNTSTAGTSSAIDGPTNSANMNNASHPAAQFCEGLSIGGFSDWYMPALNELEVCYYNLKPGTVINWPNSGINLNAVPSRGSNYSSGTPAQTSVAAFQTGGAEAFAADRYWTSTEFSSTNAWNLEFSRGEQDSGFSKGFTFIVRAIRRVPV